MAVNQFEDAIQSADYLAFTEAVMKSSADSRLAIKNNTVVIGKTKVKVPSFVSIEKLCDTLEQERRELYIKLQDLYDLIVISENPKKHKEAYEETMKKIESIDKVLEQATEHISEKNTARVFAPIESIAQKIQSNKEHARNILQNMRDDVHLNRGRVQKVVKLHHENMNLYNQLTEAHSAVEMNYVIYEQTAHHTSSIEQSAKAQNVRKSSKEGLVGGRMNNVQKAAIKDAVKKLMLGKLFSTTG